MKFAVLALLPVFLILPAFGDLAENSPHLLHEAGTIVTERESAKEVDYEALRQELAGAEVVETKTFQTDGQTLKVNPIESLALEKPAAKEEGSVIEPLYSEKESRAMPAGQEAITHEQVSLWPDVYTTVTITPNPPGATARH